MANFLRRYEKIVFICLIALSAGLHLYRIALPAAPVFDEAYFTTFAADNATGKIFFDVHPPLGKWIYALPLLFYQPSVLSGAKYVTFGHNQITGNLQTNYHPAPFGNFPYVPLRLISVFFGLLLIAGFYLLVRTLFDPIVAIAGTFLLVFENALLLETRIVLMDGMFLALGLWALYFFLKERPRPLLAGLLFGLALSIKLNVIVFAGPALAAVAMGWKPLKTVKRPFLKFITLSFAILIVCQLGLSAVIIHPHQSLDYDINFFGWPILRQIAGSIVGASWPSAAIKSFVINSFLMLSGYTSGTGGGPIESPWYTWPFMWKPILFFNNIALVGNPFVWISATAAVITAAFLSIKDAVKRKANSKNHSFVLLFLGYASCLLPFFTIVHRPTFIYHYLPALLFAIALTGVFVGRLIEKDDFASRLALTAIAIMTVVGFIIVVPYTYGI